MFNNRFNSSKNDPLVEAVKQAQAEGDLRRQAVAAVNEQFGVFSRNAVVREDLAAYDAAIEEAYKCMKEGKPVLAKKDYDKDGKIESPKDEVWGSRFRAAKAAGKMEEEQIDELSRTTLKSYVKKADRQANNLERKVRDYKDKPGDEDKMYRRIEGGNLARDKMKVRVAASEETDYSAPDRAAVTKDNKPVVSSTASQASTSGPSASDKAALTNKIKSMNEAVSRKHFQQVADLIKSNPDQAKRNELASHHAGIFAKQNPRFSHEKFHAAAGSTAHQSSEPKKMDEAAYSAKAARAGKDIGKPGKMFSKIAKKAGEKYGSEERGKKVAGAILKKIRAKHMKEDQSFKSAQVIEANAFDLGKTVPDASMKIRGGAYPSLAARIKGMATAAKGIAGTAARGLAKGFGNPVAAGVMAAMEPTPANQGENEFARQAKYAPKTTPGSMNISKQPAPVKGPSSAAAEKVGISQKMPSFNPKLNAASAPAAETPKPAPAPVPQTQTTSKSGFYKGGSLGDRTVKSGETLSGIAKSTGQSVADLAKMNNIKDVNKISAGAKLMTKVPTPAPRPADTSSSAAPTSAPAPAPTAEPEFKGRMVPPRESGIGATPPAASFVGSKREMRQGGPMTEPLSSKDFANQPPSSLSTSAPKAPAPEQKKKEAGAVPAPAPMAECVQIGANKYRIV